MDEWTLNDLLECSVCLERLDTSSKVLPCQHTFCRKCLEEIVSTHKELRCPECRILVDVQIDDLPPNVLLMRILEGMKNSGNPTAKKKGPTTFPKQLCVQMPNLGPQHNLIENIKALTAQKQNTQSNQPFARAIYDYISKEAGDLSFRKGDVILLHRKVNAQWYQGESEGKTGIFPLSYVQVIIPLPNQIATCRALYDFHMVNDEEEGCLSFKKDEVITVIRRVDENWAEGKLKDHIGIFPLAFVEMNSVAQALMKLSISQPGPSRIAPPTPNTEESTPLIPTDHSAVVSSGLDLHQSNQYNDPFCENIRPRAVVSRSCPFKSSSTVSSATTTPTSSVTSSNCSSNTSSNSNSAPNSPPTSQPPPPPPPSANSNPNPFLTASQTILQTSHITSHEVLPTTHIISQQSGVGAQPLVDTHCLWAPAPPGEPSTLVQHPKEKRHSFSVVTPTLQSNKQSSEVVSSDLGSDGQNGQLNRHGSQRHKRSGSDLSSGPTLPAGYLALYPYKPQKADELELKKGGLYLVTERCQDGWFRGTSYKTQKSGVFPGNYVTLAKSVSAFRVRDGRGTVTATQTPLHKPVHQQKTLKYAQTFSQLVPPELPPRASSPSARPQRTTFHGSSASWQPPLNDVPGTPKNVRESSSGSQAGGALPPATSNGKTQSPAYSSMAFNSTSTPTKSAEKVKEKKEKSGLIKRLTSMKRSKSPTESASYSMDNPVFDDAPAGSHHQVQTNSHPIHLRSESCPSQLIAVKPEGGASVVRIASASVSARLKHRDRSSVSSTNFTASTSRPLESNTVAKIAMSGGLSHRKSNSLDAGDGRKPKQLVPPVRERFRCIVPYPPNSEYELELKVGDIIYVHRKREDGWYKGTQQRTGRTGLFPASFVESY